MFKIQDHHRRTNRHGNLSLSVQFAKETDEIHGRRHVRTMLGSSHRWEGYPTLHVEDHFVRQYFDPLYIMRIQEHSRATNQPNSSCLERGDAKELYHVGLAKYETAIKQ